MNQGKASVLTINSGSSSIKFALYSMGESMQRTLAGKMDRIGLAEATLTFDELPAQKQEPDKYQLSNLTGYPSTIYFLFRRFLFIRSTPMQINYTFDAKHHSPVGGRKSARDLS